MVRLTVLRTSNKSAAAAKTIYLNDAGDVCKQNFKAGTWFHYEEKEVENIEGLSTLLFKLSKDNSALIIRGQLLKNKNPNETVRRLDVNNHPKDGFFQSPPAGQPWILLDFDGISTPCAINFIADPVQGVEYLISLLPPYFQKASYHYHLSSSAGLDGGKTIRAHIWYWLDHSVMDEHLRIWAKGINSNGSLIDGSLFATVQPHYTSDPVFIGVKDPFPIGRSGFVQRDTDEVPFPKILIPSYTPSGNTEGLVPAEEFEKYLSLVGDHEGGIGFNQPLLLASWFYIQANGVEGTDKAALTQKLKGVVLNADSSKHSDKSYIAVKASEAYLHGLIDSAMAKLGATGKTSKIEGLEPHFQHDEVLSAEVAQKRLEIHVRSYFDEPRHMAIRAGAGLGKTTQVIEGLSSLWMNDKKVEIYVPTHKLADEVAGKLTHHPFKKAYFPWQQKAPTGIQWQVIRGRSHPAKDGDLHCLKNQIASFLSEQGLPVYPNLCRAGKQSCEYYGNCAYIKQFNDEYDVRVYPHSYLGLDRGFLDKELPDYAVIDESFYQTLLLGTGQKEKAISLSEIKATEWPKELVQALLLYSADAPLLSYLRNKLGEDGAINCIDSALDEFFTTPATGIMSLPASEQLEIAKGLKAKTKLDKFLTVLRTELLTGRSECHGVSLSEEGFLLRYRRPITRFVGENHGVVKKVPVLAIDADLTSLVHREFFPDAEFRQINTERNCHVVQCYSTKNSKTSLTFDKGGKKRMSEIQEIIDRIGHDKTVFVLGPEDITGNQSTGKSAKITVPKGSVLAHFNAIRGIDAYKNMDTILVIGRNQPTVVGVEALARALWFDAEEPLGLGVEKLIEEPRGYRTKTGYKVGAKVSVHPDCRVQTLLELIRESETLQGIDRLRLVHGIKKKHVFLLSNLVLDLTVDNLILWDEMVKGATPLTEAWNQLDGVLPLSPDWLSVRFPSLFQKQSSSKEYLKRVGLEVGAIPNSIIIRGTHHLKTYHYTLSGKVGSPQKCVSIYSELETKERLCALMGKPVKKISLVIQH